MPIATKELRPMSFAYPFGAPCRVDTWQPDVEAALTFYGRLFGWTFAELPGGGHAAQLEGRLVAGVGQAPQGSPALWSMAVRVDDLPAAVATVAGAGGSLLMDAPDPRMAVVADPAGVPFCL